MSTDREKLGAVKLALARMEIASGALRSAAEILEDVGITTISVGYCNTYYNGEWAKRMELFLDNGLTDFAEQIECQIEDQYGDQKYGIVKPSQNTVVVQRTIPVEHQMRFK